MRNPQEIKNKVLERNSKIFCLSQSNSPGNSIISQACSCPYITASKSFVFVLLNWYQVVVTFLR